MENRVCRNKKCKKTLPDGYKHKYCEACRNKQAQGLKNGCKTIAGTVACTLLLVGTKGKINLKK